MIGFLKGGFNILDGLLSGNPDKIVKGVGVIALTTATGGLSDIFEASDVAVTVAEASSEEV